VLPAADYMIASEVATNRAAGLGDQKAFLYLK
jgi:hypothetical protein